MTKSNLPAMPSPPSELPTPENYAPTLSAMRLHALLLGGGALTLMRQAVLSKADLPDLRSYSSEAHRLLQPATDIEISYWVTRLRRHYSNAPLDQDGFDDWVMDLGDVPLDVLIAACRDWRRSPAKWAPTPGQLRELMVDLKIRRTLAERADTVLRMLEAEEQTG